MAALRRRDLLKALPAIPAMALVSMPTAAGAATVRNLRGPNFAGWTVALGDAIYAAPGEAPVSMSDIRTVHFADHSELFGNLPRRRIMAHNITFNRIIDTSALQLVHTVRYWFRMPFLPVVNNYDRNAQTLEGGLFVWDGGNTRLDNGVAFQWVLNPWTPEFGVINSWTDWNGGHWQKVGYLTPDTSWHSVSMVLDPINRTTNLVLDGTYFPSAYTRIPRPSTWGTETSSRLQAEIVSLYPGPSGSGALHQALFKDWIWVWASR